MAVYELGCLFNHSCDATLRYSSTELPGSGTFIAKRQIAPGESLTTN